MMPVGATASPPTALSRSPALPIGSRGSASRLMARVSAGEASGAVALADRRSEDGTGASPYPRFSFSQSQSLAASRGSVSRASTASTARRPPVAPVAVNAQQVLVGFDAPLSVSAADARTSLTAAAAAASSFGQRPASPVPRETRPSLLSMALSDMPSPHSLSFPSLDGLAGALSPKTGFLLSQDSPTPAAEPDMSPLNALVPQHPVLDAPVVRSAYIAAARAHAGQTRKSGESVLSHCLATAVILAELGMPEDAVAAGLVHDVLSDTRMRVWELEEYVPRGVVDLVEKVTRLSELSQLYRDNAHSLEAAAMLDMLTSMSDVTALLIKLADRTHNMRTIGALPRSKQVRMASETLDVFAVLANRLGAWSLKAELEDLSFKTLQPEDYEAVAAAVAERTAAIDLPARVAQLRAALSEAGLDVIDVSGRVKNVYGVWRKLQSAGLTVDRLSEVYDVAALRVVVPHKHDCYFALRQVEGLWSPVPGRFKDYIRNRKGNGYQSLHTTVLGHAAPSDASEGPSQLLEVQIRTPKMHYIAEYGFAAHWKYKERLSREDLWLDRLVQWKKWVAANKLRLRDAKVRTEGSPQRDLAIAGLIDVAASLGAAVPPAASAAAAAAPAPAAEQEGRPSPSGASAAELDARFMARFSIAPVSESDLAAHGASVMVSGPRGARVHEAAPGATLAELLATSAPEARRCDVRLNGRPVAPAARGGIVLQPGDHVAFVEEERPAPAPRLAPAGATPALVGAAAAAGSGGRLDVFFPGQAAPLEVALRQGLASSTSQLRQAALAL